MRSTTIFEKTPHSFTEQLISTVTHKGLCVLLGDRKLHNRYPTNGKFIVCPMGRLINKPVDIKKGCIPLQPIHNPIKTIADTKLAKLINNKGFSVNKKRVQDAIFSAVNAQRHYCRSPKLFFFTVSFPPQVSDSLGYKMLNTWLTRLRQYLKEKSTGLSYLWVAERQENGTIHFHIPVFHYLNVTLANRFMVAVMRTQVNKGLLPMSIYQVKRYNGVDIAKNRKTKKVVNFADGSKQRSLSVYLSKYVSKNDATFQHLAWNCSQDISSLKTRVGITDREFDRVDWWDRVDWDKKREIGDKVKGLFAVWFPWKSPPPTLINHLGLLNYSILKLLDSPVIKN